MENRPMPTGAICKAYNELRQDLITLFDLQKHSETKEYQVQVLREQKVHLPLHNYSLLL